jgi:protein gp37
MADNSAIEWTDATWNPVTGCTKVSPACANCYIERQTPMRVAGRKFVRGHIPLEFHENRMDAPLRRRQPTTYFVNSMSDLFHEDVPDAFIVGVFATMALAPRHTFQVLTKRPHRMRDLLGFYRPVSGPPPFSQRVLGYASQIEGRPIEELPWPLPNVWLGVSVENQHFADERIPLLLETPAAVRFLSCEPLLGPLDLDRGGFTLLDPIKGPSGRKYPGLDWVIAGGESGPRVRPSDPAWFMSLRDQCVAAGVPFFFKQWGGRTAKSGGRLLDGRTWNQMPTARA